MLKNKRKITTTLLFAFLLMIDFRDSIGAEPAGNLMLVLKSDLPDGNGLAAAFVADENISDHRDVIFSDNFEKGKLGVSWDDRRNRDNKVLSLINDPSSHAPVGKKFLQVKATLGDNTGGGLTKWFKPADRIFIRFYTKFDSECDYVHHFCTLRANKSLQGGERWSGFGGAGNRPVGNERFSTALEPWGNWGKSPAPGRWNFYSYWHSMKKSNDGRYWGNAFRPESQPNIKKEKWICAEFMLKHNTPSLNDGEQAYWINGELRGHWQGINWRTSPTLWANALTLETYITDRWTKNKTNTVFFDNVVIARQYIGPAGKQ